MKYARMVSLIVMSFLLMATPGWAEMVAQRSLGVQGNAEIKVPADWVSVRIGVETVAEQAEEALDNNNDAMEKVREALLGAGVTEAELSTGRFAINPRWQPRPPNNAASNDSNWTPKIIAYQVSNHLQIESGKLEQVGEWLQAATEAGANSLGDLNFGLEDADKHRGQAIELATEKARSYARSAATAAGVTLGQITLIEVDGASVTPRVQQLRQGGEMAMMAMSDRAAKVSVEPGEIEVHATVRLNFSFD